MKCEKVSDVKNAQNRDERKCHFCRGTVKRNPDGKWVCTKCGFWYDKLLERR